MPLKKQKEEKFIVPGWMVSFSDMIVNLMCFFILLNSMAPSQESGFMGAGTGEYQDAINAEGKPGLMPAGRNLLPLEAKGGRYAAPKVDPLDKPNWTEHTKASIEDEFDRLAHSKSRVESATRSFPIPLGVTFSKTSAVMSDQERRDLDFLAPTIASRNEVLEVVGACAPDECADERAALELSFARAQVVAHRLQYDGVPAQRIVPIGVGASCPDAVADVQPKSNRRVALRWQLPQQ
jgi:flagellar motor protein MotB